MYIDPVIQENIVGNLIVTNSVFTDIFAVQGCILNFSPTLSSNTYANINLIFEKTTVFDNEENFP